MKGNWKLYILLICLGLGGFFEALKSASNISMGENPAKISAGEMKALNISPYSISEDQKKISAKKASLFKRNKTFSRSKSRISNRFPQVRPHSFTENLGKNGKKKAVAGKAKAKKEKKDAKKKKDKKGKKKAKVKETDKKAPESTLDEPIKEAKEEKKEQAPDNDSTVVPVGGGPAPGTNNKNPDSDEENEAIYEEWAAQVLEEPNLKNTSALIAAYQSHTVPAEVFYQLVNAMIEDPRKEMKKMGITAAGATPSHTSFLVLIRVIEQEGSNSFLGNMANKHFRKYEKLAYLGIIRAILSDSENRLAVVTAASILEKIAKRQENVPSNPNEPKDPLKENNQQYNSLHFAPFVALLEEIVANTNDSYLTNSLQHTIDSLQALLGA